jgi:hypothetical protein
MLELIRAPHLSSKFTDLMNSFFSSTLAMELMCTAYEDVFSFDHVHQHSQASPSQMSRTTVLVVSILSNSQSNKE